MSTALLKDKIHRAIEDIDDEHFLEVIFTMLNKNTRFNEYEFDESNFGMADSSKLEAKCGESKNYALNEVKENPGKPR